MDRIMTMQEEHKVQDHMLLDRLDTLLKPLMEDNGIDMWIVMGDEYNEGPTLKTLLPSAFFHARRKSIIIFYNNGQSVERMIVSKPDFTIDRFYTPILLKPPNFDYKTFYTTFAKDYDINYINSLPIEDTYDCINRVIKEKDPKTIALEFSDISAFADGLSHNHYIKLMSSLDENYQNRVISSEYLSISWLATRSSLEMTYMKLIVDKTREIIKKCYSKDIIIPGQTSIADARYYLMETARTIGMIPWFDATVWIKRKDHPHLSSDDEIIQTDDLLHCDFGVKYLGLCSDVQEMAYVASDNMYLLNAYQEVHEKCKDLQNIVTCAFKEGLTGNEILHRALNKAGHIEGPVVFTHPIGFYGHGPGPSIGLYSNQKYVEKTGQLKLENNTCFALELCVKQYVKLIDTTILYGQEIDVLFKDGQVHYFSGRQEELHII